MNWRKKIDSFRKFNEESTILILWVELIMGEIKVINIKDAKEFFEGDERCKLYVKTEKIVFGTSYLEPGKEGTIDSGHKYGEEIFFVAKGKVTCKFSKTSKNLEEGDAVIIPIGEPHKLINKHDAPTLICWALAPPDD